MRTDAGYYLYFSLFCGRSQSLCWQRNDFGRLKRKRKCAMIIVSLHIGHSPGEREELLWERRENQQRSVSRAAGSRRTGSREFSRSIRARPLNMRRASRWGVCSIWKRTDISIQDSQTRRTTQSPEKICELEGGVAAMLTSSGQAANYYAAFNICNAGDHIISAATIYGGTSNLFTVTMKKRGSM